MPKKNADFYYRASISHVTVSHASCPSQSLRGRFSVCSFNDNLPKGKVHRHEKNDSCEQEGESRVVYKFQKLASKERKTFYERIGFAYKFGSD